VSWIRVVWVFSSTQGPENVRICHGTRFAERTHMVVQAYWKSVVLGALIAVSLASAPANACEAMSGIQGFLALPAEGSRVPRSTALWLRSDLPVSGSSEKIKDPGAVRLIDERGKSVGLTSTGVRVSGDEPSTLFVLKPTSLLEANTAYRVELNGVVITRFSTSEDIDTQPPGLPKATVQAQQLANSCNARVTVTVESPGDVNFLVPAANASTTIPAAALAVASQSALTAAGVAEGTVDLRVVAFDLSGNMAMSSDKLSTFVPSEAAGCSSTLAAPGIGALALVAMLRRRRRS